MFYSEQYDLKCINCNTLFDEDIKSRIDKKIVKDMEFRKKKVQFEQFIQTPLYGKNCIEKFRKSLKNNGFENMKKKDLTKSDLKKLNHNTTEKKEIVFKKKCFTPECRGYIFDESCLVCEKMYCHKCNAEKTDEDHECKKNDLESASYLRQNCKNCPKCNTFVFKVDGCDHMFCVACKCFFSWNTLTVFNKAVGNPDYYRYIRDNNLSTKDFDVNPAECEDNVFFDIINQNEFTKSNEMFKELLNFIGHFDFVNEQLAALVSQNNRSLKNIQVEYVVDFIDYNNAVKEFAICNELTSEVEDIENGMRFVKSSIISFILNNPVTKKLDTEKEKYFYYYQFSQIIVNGFFCNVYDKKHIPKNIKNSIITSDISSKLSTILFSTVENYQLENNIPSTMDQFV